MLIKAKQLTPNEISILSDDFNAYSETYFLESSVKETISKWKN